MDNKVNNCGPGKDNKVLSTVDALNKQVNILRSELREINDEKKGGKYNRNKYLCRDSCSELNAITGAGRPVVDNVKPRGNNCYNCSKILDDREYCCISCKSVHFCGKNCQIQYWKDHKQVCKAISTLIAQG